MKAIYLLPIALLAAGCTQEKEEDDSAEVAQLYAQLQKVYVQYTDSMGQATDSASIYNVEEGLNAALRKTYQAHKPDLDQRLSQTQNDSLWALAQKYMKVREARKNLKAAPDSVAADSLAK